MNQRQQALPGGDLFTPFQRRRGLPIGNLTSQLLANVYLDCLDYFATDVLRAPWLRTVDDFALFHDDPAVLREWRPANRNRNDTANRNNNLGFRLARPFERPESVRPRSRRVCPLASGAAMMRMAAAD